MIKLIETLSKDITKVVTPLVYLFFWYAIPAAIFGRENLNVRELTLAALPVIFIGVISKQTRWTIGGESVLSGDNIGKRASATVDRKGSFEIDGMDLEEKDMETIIKAVTENPIFTDKKRQRG